MITTFLGIKSEAFTEWLNHHRDELLGGIVGGSYAVFDAVTTLPATAFTSIILYDVNTILVAIVKAVVITCTGIYVGRLINKYSPEKKDK